MMTTAYIVKLTIEMAGREIPAYLGAGGSRVLHSKDARVFATHTGAARAAAMAFRLEDHTGEGGTLRFAQTIVIQEH